MRHPHMHVARLGRPDGDAEGFAALRADFERRNPGYGLSWHPESGRLPVEDRARLLFVHQGATPDAAVGAERSALAVGDVVLLRPGRELDCGSGPLGLLGFAVPVEPDAHVPTFLRPDHDPRLTDTPGGCATQDDAYRRVVLTWLRDNGPYRFQGLNTHRVRMVDSFSHYHPVSGGFDEIYLVQEVGPGGVVHTSDRVAEIERPESVSRETSRELITSTPVEVGDLICVARGNMHRAVGGVLAHVITVPGFVPGQEIGVDHHLKAIDDRLGLQGEEALPYHADAADRPVVK